MSIDVTVTAHKLHTHTHVHITHTQRVPAAVRIVAVVLTLAKLFTLITSNVGGKRES